MNTPPGAYNKCVSGFAVKGSADPAATLPSSMFEKIILRRSEGGPALTLGEIAEALLFYQNVHLVLDYGTLLALVESLGMGGLLSLLARDNVTAVYTEEMLATKTEANILEDLHTLVAFMVSGDQTTGDIASRRGRLEYLLQK